MKCQRCNSTRVLHANGKSSDCNAGSVNDKEWDGYIPRDLGIGGGDYYDIEICLDCGQAQGYWPLPLSKLESGNS